MAKLGQMEAEAAIAAADKAWPAWRNKTAKERSIILRKWFDVRHRGALLHQQHQPVPALRI